MTSVLAVAPVDHPGGAEIGLLRLLPRLPWQATLTTPGNGPLAQRARELGLRTDQLDVGGLAARAGARAVRSWPKARRLANAHDITYLNGTTSGRLLPALRGRRTVLHVHDLVERVPSFWKQADVILADSQATAERLEGLDAHVVGCPIEPDPPETTPPWRSDGRPVVGYVGRIEPRKGVLDLIRAAPLLEGVRVVVIGEDPFSSDPGYVAEVDASEHVERYPWVPNADGLMGALDVLVLPSRAEPFGTVLAEAMNAGTPVVATRVGGLPEVVDDGVTGRLVEPGDPQALAEAVREVLAARDTMGAAARERATRWHADVYARRVAELIAP